MYKVIKDPLSESVELSTSQYMLTLDGLKKWFKRSLNIDLAYVFTSNRREAIRDLMSERGDNTLPYNDRFALVFVNELASDTEDTNNFANRRFGAGNHCTSEEDNVTVWTSHAFKIRLNLEVIVYVRDILDYLDLQTKLYILCCHRASLFYTVTPAPPAVPFNVANVEPITSISLTKKEESGGTLTDFFELNVPLSLSTSINAIRKRAKFNNEGSVMQSISVRGNTDEELTS